MTNNKTEELQVIYGTHKSFYKKAIVEFTPDGNTNLYSYNKLVAYIDKYNKLTVYGTYSVTTLRHIREFILQYTSINHVTKKDIEEMIK